MTVSDAFTAVGVIFAILATVGGSVFGGAWWIVRTLKGVESAVAVSNVRHELSAVANQADHVVMHRRIDDNARRVDDQGHLLDDHGNRITGLETRILLRFGGERTVRHDSSGQETVS